MAYQPILNPMPVSESGTFNVNVSNASIPVTGTFWQATQPVSGTVTANAGTGTFAISAASLPLPTGAAQDSTLAALSAKTPALGQAVAANSQPVVIASDQSRVPVAIDATTKAAISVAEQLDQLFAAQCATIHLLSQILAVSRGLNAPLPGEEVDALLGEFMDARANNSNIMN